MKKLEEKTGYKYTQSADVAIEERQIWTMLCVPDNFDETTVTLISDEQAAAYQTQIDAYNAELTKKYLEEQGDTTSLTEAIANKIAAIKAYDSSTAVNEFFFNGNSLWFDAETRAGFKNSIESAILLGETTIDVPTTIGIITLPVETAQTILAKVQRYADNCYLVTQQHLAAVAALTTLAEVLSYDYTTGYPDKEQFTV